MLVGCPRLQVSGGRCIGPLVKRRRETRRDTPERRRPPGFEMSTKRSTKSKPKAVPRKRKRRQLPHCQECGRPYIGASCPEPHIPKNEWWFDLENGHARVRVHKETRRVHLGNAEPGWREETRAVITITRPGYPTTLTDIGFETTEDGSEPDIEGVYLKVISMLLGHLAKPMLDREEVMNDLDSMSRELQHHSPVDHYDMIREWVRRRPW